MAYCLINSMAMIAYISIYLYIPHKYFINNCTGDRCFTCSYKPNMYS